METRDTEQMVCSVQGWEGITLREVAACFHTRQPAGTNQPTWQRLGAL